MSHKLRLSAIPVIAMLALFLVPQVSMATSIHPQQHQHTERLPYPHPYPPYPPYSIYPPIQPYPPVQPYPPSPIYIPVPATCSTAALRLITLSSSVGGLAAGTYLVINPVTGSVIAYSSLNGTILATGTIIGNTISFGVQPGIPTAFTITLPANLTSGTTTLLTSLGNVTVTVAC